MCALPTAKKKKIQFPDTGKEPCMFFLLPPETAELS